MKPKIKLLVLDGDGTCWHYPYNRFGSSWEALSKSLGVEEETSRLLEEYYSKPDSDEEWIEKHVDLFRGKSVELAKRELSPIPYSRGLKEFMQITKGKMKRGLLTAGIDLVAEKAAEELDLDFCYCNKIHKKNGKFTGTLEYNVPMWGKHEVFEREILNGFKTNEIIFVGDTKGDVLCMSSAGLRIAFKLKDKQIEVVADYIIDDFKELGRILNLG